MCWGIRKGKQNRRSNETDDLLHSLPTYRAKTGAAGRVLIWSQLSANASGIYTDTVHEAENEGFYRIKVQMAP